MSVVLTYAGESLIASLQAGGQPLVIDKFLFANVPGLDHTAPVDPALGVLAEVVHEFTIPPEYRAFVTPNQVVYSALLGSDIGPFTFNWQGLYCSEHDVLVAVATFPAMEKRAYDPNTNTQGNNLTRNFLLEFTGARELTQITVEAGVWQLDFTVRLKGIDERERLSNRDLYGRSAFLDDGWLLTHDAGYRFEAGRGYVEGIRAALAEPLVVVPSLTPCDVWLDVSMQRQGSDVVTVVSPMFLDPSAPAADYTEGAPYHVPHYCVQVASIAADGTVTDLRQKGLAISPEQVGAATPQQVEDLADAFQGFELDGEHTPYMGDLDAIARNSLYAVQQGVATHLPEDLPAEAWAFCQTMVLPGDIGRTQVVWSEGDPDRPGWWRRRAAGVWGDWRLIGSGVGMPVGTVFFWPGATAPAGAIAIPDGPLLSRATWPELWAIAEASGNIITEAEWQAQAAVQSSVGSFSSGDGATTFRTPRWRDFGRAADPSNGRPVGTWQEDAARRLYGEVLSGAIGSATANFLGDQVAANGALELVNPGSKSGCADTGGAAYGADKLILDSALTLPTADENRPKSVSWLPCIQAATVPTDAGTVNMLQLASDLAGLEGSKADKAELAQNNVLIARDEKAQGTAGGTFTSGAWRTRDLAEKVNSIPGASVAANQITLPAGTYLVDARAPSYGTVSHQAKLYDVTHAQNLIVGTVERTDGSYPSQTSSCIRGKIVLAEATAIEVQHICSLSRSTNGLGFATNFATEVYTGVIIERIG
ncbi:phage tail protein [Desulfocurvibacter africanus]|uniref:phage tail-collar fiber domain-containing protein n=1 Tax=Desulfocurvibacter africanus TaxID=873 RepID=UPI00041DE5E4|nr:phage tail protein [Desulfocurvibacter africanus]